MNFYLAITTIKKYKVALDLILSSLPQEWKNKYIIVYNDEKFNKFEIFDDGHIEVYIKNNLSDYGNWVGINILLQNNIIPQNTWFLFVHDTCKFLNDSEKMVYDIIKKYSNNFDIIWLSNNGQCNICLTNSVGVSHGNNLYKNINYMTKMETIKYEWNFKNKLSLKSLKIKHHFLNNETINLGKRFVYNNNNERDVLLFTSINMEKYYFFTKQESDHPFMP